MTTPGTAAAAELLIGDRVVPIRVERTARRKTVAVSVGPDGVRVLAPAEMPDADVARVVEGKRYWILQKLGRFDDVGLEPAAHEFVSGESFYYLGRSYRLKVQRTAGIIVTDVKLRGAHLVAPVGVDLDEGTARLSVHSGLKRWYRNAAKRRLPERLALYSEKLGVRVPPLSLREQEKRWASCDKVGRIRCNWQLIMAPLPLIDYVVAHELCHLVEHNHSRRFWDLLGVILPDYE